MGRLHLTDEEVRPIIHSLVLLYLKHGSVNALCGALDAVSEEKTYPNRIHTLLGGKPNQSINEKTVMVIEVALSKLPPITVDGVAEAADSIRQLAKSHESLSLEALSEKIGTPLAVLRQVLGCQWNDPLAPLAQLVKELAELRGEILINERERLLALLEQVSHLSAQYIRMLNGLDEN